jgi:hypothetical protein
MFDEGDSAETQVLWSRHFPVEVISDGNVLQFEFYLQLYFAIYPLLDTAKSASGSSIKVCVEITLKVCITFFLFTPEMT